MNMYVSPDQNTVVLWAGDNAPRLLTFNQNDSGCSGGCAFELITHVNGIACGECLSTCPPPCMPRFRRDRLWGNFRRLT